MLLILNALNGTVPVHLPDSYPKYLICVIAILIYSTNVGLAFTGQTLIRFNIFLVGMGGHCRLTKGPKL